MIALDLVVDKETREPIDPAGEFANDVAAVARREGVLVRPVGTKIILSPPLIFSQEHCDKVADALKYRRLPKSTAGSIGCWPPSLEIAVQALDVNSRQSIVAVLYLAVVGPCVFILQPGFVQGLVEYVGLSGESGRLRGVRGNVWHRRNDGAA